LRFGAPGGIFPGVTSPGSLVINLISSSAALLCLAFSAGALAADVDEQSRRCNMEKNSLTNPSKREGPECLKLRAMLGMPEPTVVKNYYRDDSDSCKDRNRDKICD
jgi:hypothetical protein